VSDWSDWSACVEGTQTRTRTIIIPASGGGEPCPVLSETQPCSDPVDCVALISNAISPIPQTGSNNYFGVNVAINPWPVGEDVTVSGYIADDSNTNNRQDFSITITSPNQFGETANNILQTDPSSTATAHITGFSPTNVTFEGESYTICGYEPVNCLYYLLEIPEVDTLTISYYDCNNDFVALEPRTGPDIVPICAKEGSILVVGEGDYMLSTGKEDPFCGASCVVSDWSDWSACVEGVRTRTRTVITPASGYGTPCPVLEETESCVLTFANGFNSFVDTIKPQSDNKLVVGGRFTQYKGLSVQPLVRLLPNGNVDPSFTVSPITLNNGTQANITSSIVLNDGTIIVGGAFQKYGGTNTTAIMKLNPNGTLNTASNVLDNGVREMIMDQSGNILVFGPFTNNGDIVKLNPNLTLNTSWVTSSTQRVRCFELVEGSINRLYAGIVDSGFFAGYRIESYNYSTGAYVGISADFNRPVRAIKSLPDGRLLVVGEFTTFNNQPTRQIVVLNSDLTLNTTFPNGFSSDAPNIDGVATMIFIQNDGKILIGGSTSLTAQFTPSTLDFMPPFKYFNGVECNSIIRLNSDFTIDTTFTMGTGFGLTESINPSLGVYANIFEISAQYDSETTNLLFGGYIQKYNGANIGYIVSTDINGVKNSF
jgi:uncharacterized delta-60 repeat protein